MADGNGQTAVPTMRPASFLRNQPAQPRQPQPQPQPPNGANQIQLGVRDPQTNKIDWVLPNFGRYPVSHVTSFQSMLTSAARVYRQYDEAVKHSLDNARYMRNDCGIMECVEARQRCVSLLNWHLEPEDDKSHAQKELCGELKKILNRIRRFPEYRVNLLHAIWYGRYGIQHQYGWQNVAGHMRLLPTPRKVGDMGWSPVHGDKLCFRFDDGSLQEGQHDGQVGIRVGTTYVSAKLLHDRRKVEITDRGMAYFLDEDERKLIAIHKHMIEDGEFEDAISAGKIHGVGIRSRIYWEWVQKQETLGFLMEYLERCAGGIQLWKYPSGNAKAKQEVETAAQTYDGGSRNVVTVPIPMGDESGQYGVEIIEPGMAGIDMLKDLVDNHFGHRIKRYILGQVLSSEAESTGLGSGVAEAHMDTLMQIIRYDAANLEETITFELLNWIKEWNFPEARNIHIAFRIDTESEDAKEKLEAFQIAYQMGCKLRSQDVMDLIGAAIPGPDDEVLSQQQQQQEQAMMGMPPGGPQGIGAGGVHGGGMPKFGGPEDRGDQPPHRGPSGDDGDDGTDPRMPPPPDRGGGSEQYAKLKPAKGQKSFDEHWVTIGGEPDDKGHQHAGGTPVKIDGQGNIKAGPKAITQKAGNLRDLSGDRGSSREHGGEAEGTNPRQPEVSGSSPEVQPAGEHLDPQADWKQNGTRSKAFKAWFGDWETDPANSSKVVNPETGEPQETSPISGQGSQVMRDGKPVAVYHGTSANFDQFDATKDSGENLYGPGFYFTEKREVAAGEFGESGDYREFDSEEEAKAALANAQGTYRYGLPWKTDAGKWGVTVGNKPKLKSPGYAQKGLALTPDQRKAIVKNLRANIERMKGGYWSKNELDHINRKVKEFSNGYTAMGNDYTLDRLREEIGGQPYNIDPYEAAHQAGVNIKGNVHEVYLNIRKPLHVDKVMDKETAYALADAVSQLWGAHSAAKALRKYGDTAHQVANDKSGRTQWAAHPSVEVALADVSNNITVASAVKQMSDGMGGTREVMTTTPFSKKQLQQLAVAAGFDGLTHTGGQHWGGYGEHRVWIAFQPTQIKSSDNQGTFDPNDERMKYARKAAKGQGELFNPDAQGKFDWVTIGGHSDDKGHHHAGGTPVKIEKSTGKIVAGPDALEGKTVGELKGGESEKKKPHELFDDHLTEKPKQNPRANLVTADKHPGNGNIITDESGKEWLVMKARHGFVEGAPIENGKAIVNANSIHQFYVGNNIADKEPDKLYETGRNYYEEQEAAKSGQSASEKDPSKMTLAEKLAWQKENPGKGKVKPKPLPQKKTMAKVSGAQYEFVKENGDGTITVRNEQGDEFSTDQNEPWEVDEGKRGDGKPSESSARERDYSDQEKGYREQARTAEEVLAAGPAEFKNQSIRDLTLARGHLNQEVRRAQRRLERGEITRQQRDDLIHSCQIEGDAIDAAIKDHVNGRTSPPDNMSRAEKIAEKAHLENRPALSVAKEMGLTTDEFRDIRKEVESDIAERREMESGVESNSPSPARKKAMEAQQKRQAAEDSESTGWLPENHVKIAADSIDKLRGQDVYRLLDSAPPEYQQSMAGYIRKHRPDLSGDVHDAEIDIAEERGQGQATEPETDAATNPAENAQETPVSTPGVGNQPVTEPQGDVKSSVMDHLLSGKNMSLRELQQAVSGKGGHDPDNPLSHPVNAALKELRDSGAISVHEPRRGEPSFWMTDDQIAAHKANGNTDAAAEGGEQAPAGTAGNTPEAASDVGESQPEPEEPKTPHALFDDAQESGATPREAADAASKAADPDYEFARQSAVPNAGEDLKNSARHKVNAWRGLQEAESDGTAEAMVTRDNLLKAEPHGLMSHADKNPLTALAMHNALKAFPARPGYGNEKRLSRRSPDEVKKDRAQYLDAYREIKAKAEELAANQTNPKDAMNDLREFVLKKVKDLRASKIPVGDAGASLPDQYNNTANSLIDLYNKLSGSAWEAKKSTNLHGKLNEFVGKLAEKYGTEDMAQVYEKAKAHAKDLIEGRSLPATFGESQTGQKRQKDFDPAAEYVAHAVRKGGPNIGQDVATPQKATKYMTDKLGMRGVQWGNSVTDDEREHHARMSAEAFADLADILGLPPSAVSLGGKLGLAIGARGHGTAMAHYEPGSVVINLTRKNGVGTLAHEWGHGFDHLLGGFKVGRGADGKLGATYKSADISPQRFDYDPVSGVKLDENKRPVMIDNSKEPIWAAMNGVRQAMRDSGFDKRLGETIRKMVEDGDMSKNKREYWKSHHEKFARSFERYVQHKLQSSGRENTYLSGLAEKGVNSGEPHPLWPNHAEIAAMAPAFDALFEAYKTQAGHGPQKYSRSELVGHFLNEIRRETAAEMFDRLIKV